MSDDSKSEDLKVMVMCEIPSNVLRAEELATRPFCCARCKLLDLYKWLNEDIVISQTNKEAVIENDAEN